jgi:hypothetical protein
MAATPTFDPNTATLAPGQFNPDTAVPVASAPAAAAPANSGVTEVGKGFLRGALVDLPSMVGKAAQYAGGSFGSQGLSDFGQGVAQSAEERGKSDALTLRPDQHSGLVNNLAAGAGMIAPGLAIPVAAGVAALAAPEALAGGLATAGLVAGGVVGGAAAGQDTLDQAKASGASPQAANTAAALNFGINTAAQVIGGKIGGKILGVASGALGQQAAADGSKLLPGIMNDLTGAAPYQGFGSTLLKGTAEAAGVNAAAAAGTAGVNSVTGVDQDADPIKAAMASLGPSLGMSAVLAPAGLAGRALAARSAQTRTSVLASEHAPEEVRNQLADQYAQSIAKSGTPEAVAAAATFRKNASEAIGSKLPLQVDPGLFLADAVKAPVDENGQRGLPLGDTPVPTAENAPLPTNVPVARDLFGNPVSTEQPTPQGEQVAEQANLPLTPPAGGDLFGDLPPNATPEQQSLFQEAPWAFPKSTAPDVSPTPDLFDTAAAQDAAAARRLPVPVDAEPAPASIVVGTDGVARTPEQVAAQAAEQRTLGNDLRNKQTPPELATPEEIAANVPAVDPNATKARSDITNDLQAVNEANSFSNRKQDNARVEKALDTLGIDKQPDHNAQIDALDAHLNDPDAKLGQATRDKLQALSDKWHADRGDMPPAADPVAEANVPTPEAAPAANEAVAPAPVPVDPQAVTQAATEIAKEAVPVAEPAAEPARPTTQAEAQAAKPVDTTTVEPKLPPLDVPAADARRNRIQELQQAIRDGKGLDAVPSPEVRALGDNLPASRQQQAIDMIDKLNAAKIELNQQKRAGKTLSPLEQERLEDIDAHRSGLSEVANGTASPDQGDFALQNAQSALKPYTESLRKYAAADPNDVNVHIFDKPPGQSSLDGMHNVNDGAQVLKNIFESGSTQDVKDYAKQLLDLGIDNKVINTQEPEEAFLRNVDGQGTGAAGAYFPDTGTIRIYQGGETESTVLHEFTHAALYHRIEALSAMDKPTSQKDAVGKAALGTLNKVMERARQLATPEDHYGLTNIHEFTAELKTNTDFQAFLKSKMMDNKSLWTRTLDAVKRIIGIKGDPTFFEQAMDATNSLLQPGNGPNDAGFPAPQGSTLYKMFNKSPADAAKATDGTYSKLADLADNTVVPAIDKISRIAYKALMGFKTVDYIADRVRAVDQFRKAGLSAALDKYQLTHEIKRVTANAMEAPMTTYANKVQDMITKAEKTGNGKGRELSEKFATIGGEASRGEFDFTKNYADNAKTRSGLDPKNKAYIDDIHRQFTQLPADAQKILVEGAQLNRKTLINTTSTVARNLLQNATGKPDALQAELDRIPLGDPARAQAEANLQSAKNASSLAARWIDKLDIMGQGLNAAKNSDPARFHDGSDSQLHANIQGALADANKTLPQGDPLRNSLAELSRVYNAQEQNPYFSLGRDGEFFAKVGFKNMDAATQQRIQDALKGSNKVVGNLMGGEDHVFFRTDTPEQARALHDKIVQAAGDKVVDGSGAYGKLLDQSNANATGVPSAMRDLLANLHDTVDNANLSPSAAAAMRDTLSRQVLSMLPETSSRSAKMKREGVPGYDSDYLGNWSRRATGGVQDITNAYTQRSFSDAVSDMKKSTQTLARQGDIGLQSKAVDTVNEVLQRYANSQSKLDNKAINTINSLGHTFYLAASPAYLIRTMAQPFHRAVPLIGSRYGMVNSSRAIAGATGDALNIVKNVIGDGFKNGGGLQGVLRADLNVDKLNLPDNEKAFLKEMQSRGILNLGQAHQLQSMALGGTQRQQNLTRMAGMTAQYSEMLNRLSTGLAAFRLAEKGTQGVDQAGHTANTEYALKVVNRAMDNFDQSNTARQIGKFGFLGKGTPLLTQFMNYNLQTMQQLARTVHDGWFQNEQRKVVANDPAALAELNQRSKEAKKEFAGLFATTAMISGGLGLPFANTFAGVYNTLTNDDQDPQDIRISAQNHLDALFGHTLGGVVAHGIPHALGFDSSTFGLENLLPGSDFLASRSLLKDRLSEQSTAMLGPALNAGIGLLQGADKFSDGYYAKGIEAMLPSGLKPYFKAAELATHGYTDAKGNPIGIDANAWDVGLQAVGFNSAKRANQMELSQFNAARQARLEYARNMVGDKFYKGVTNQDPAEIQAAAESLQSFNRSNPTAPIRDVEGGIRQKITALALGRASGTGVSVNKAGFPMLNQYGAFAVDPDTVANAAMPRR